MPDFFHNRIPGDLSLPLFFLSMTILLNTTLVNFPFLTTSRLSPDSLDTLPFASLPAGTEFLSPIAHVILTTKIYLIMAFASVSSLSHFPVLKHKNLGSYQLHWKIQGFVLPVNFLKNIQYVQIFKYKYIECIRTSFEELTVLSCIMLKIPWAGYLTDFHLM